MNFAGTDFEVSTEVLQEAITRVFNGKKKEGNRTKLPIADAMRQAQESVRKDFGDIFTLNSEESAHFENASRAVMVGITNFFWMVKERGLLKPSTSPKSHVATTLTPLEQQQL